MIIDCTMYNGERELLEIRLATLGPFVDRFIITEGFTTHQGDRKITLTFPEPEMANLGTRKASDVFPLLDLPFKDKIRFIPVDMPGGSRLDAWEREHFQRDLAKDGMNWADANDTILVGDLDEIPNPAIFADLRAGACEMRMTQGWLNWFCPVPWNGTVVIRRSDMGGMTLTEVRNTRTTAPPIPNGGWHFTYCGGVEAVQRKLRSFAHTEYSGPPFTDAKYIRERFEAGVCLFDPPDLRRFWPAPITDLPEYVQRNREKFAHLIREA